MRVVLTRSALSDLDAVADWIGRDSWDHAEAFVLDLRARCLALSNHPNRYPQVHALDGNLRKLTYRGYLIFYRTAAAQVEVIHILHGARDWEALLRDEQEMHGGGHGPGNDAKP